MLLECVYSLAATIKNVIFILLFIQNFPNNGTIKNKIYSPLKLWVWVVCAMWTGLPAIHMTRLNITDTAKNLVCTFIYTILYKKLVWFLKKEGNISNSLQ